MNKEQFDINLVPTWRQGYRFQFETAQNKYVILYPEGMIQLNESASEIGQLIDGKLTTNQIIVQLEQKYPTASELAGDVDLVRGLRRCGQQQRQNQ